LESQELRKRGEKSEKYFQKVSRTRRYRKFEIEKVDWLSAKYIMLYGLRGWTWRLIIDGIISENMLEEKKVDVRHIRLLWYTFLDVVGIKDLDSVPDIRDPEGQDTKAAMYMYSMESFLYKRINKVLREKDNQSIKTLGPYAALISRVI
jgi:hypothetical protein